MTDDDGRGRTRGLTPRQLRVLTMVTEGRTNDEIAAETGLPPTTVKTIVRGAYREIGVRSRSEAVLWGLHHGLVATEGTVTGVGAGQDDA